MQYPFNLLPDVQLLPVKMLKILRLAPYLGQLLLEFGESALEFSVLGHNGLHALLYLSKFFRKVLQFAIPSILSPGSTDRAFLP